MLTRLTISSNPILLPDKSTFVRLYDEYASALFGLILQQIPEKQLAEKVLCAVFDSAFRQIALYNHENSRVFTWLLGIARQEIDLHCTNKATELMHDK